ncbi:MAG TPA: glycosyltransferase [Terriglobia bacterium]|nr:glycosyltransferase [Terriglobia bacterium]
MRVLIVNTDYPTFQTWFYEQNPGLAQAAFDEQMRARNESLFGVADFYSRNLRKLGHEAWDVYANNDIMQSAWAKEHGMDFKAGGLLRTAKRLATVAPLRYLKPMLRLLLPVRASFQVLAAQVRHYRPDILLNQAMDEIPDDFLWEIKSDVRIIVGQIASPLVTQRHFRSYDLVISSLPNFVDYFRKQGVRSELNRLAFEPSILQRLEERPRTTDVSFVGSLSSYHKARARLVETICENVPLSWWGQGDASIRQSSILSRRYRGPAWGLAMYQVLRDSKITLNNHIDIAENYANNMRLFEATGAGTMLVTDRKQNLHEMFEPGKEVAVYGSADECIEVIRHYLDHEREREAIARAGQQRTLRDHNYAVRMQELMALLTGCMAA